MIRDTSATDRVIAAPAASRQRKLTIAAIVAAALALTGFAAPKVVRMLGANRSVALAQVRIAPVTRGTLVRDVSAQGRVVAAVSPTLYAPAAGTVTLRIRAGGDVVAKDQVLAEVASPELTNELEQEQASLQSLDIEVQRARIQNRQAQLVARRAADQAGIELAAAQREWERAELGWARGAISQVDHLKARDEVRKAEISNTHALEDARLQGESLAFELRTKELALERQRLAVVELERKVEALKIRSPIDGLVGTLAVADRANVAANAPIATVVDLSRFEVEIEIPEVYSDDIGLGMAAEVRIGSEQHAGILGSISPEVVDGQVRGRVRFSGEQPPGLRQSQRVTARLVIEEKPDVLMVQRGPFFDADAGRFAYVVADGTAVRRPIRTGATSMTAVEILDGLRAGESIIVSDTTDFRGAQRVNLN